MYNKRCGGPIIKLGYASLDTDKKHLTMLQLLYYQKGPFNTVEND